MTRSRKEGGGRKIASGCQGGKVRSARGPWSIIRATHLVYTKATGSRGEREHPVKGRGRETQVSSLTTAGEISHETNTCTPCILSVMRQWADIYVCQREMDILTGDNICHGHARQLTVSRPSSSTNLWWVYISAYYRQLYSMQPISTFPPKAKVARVSGLALPPALPRASPDRPSNWRNATQRNVISSQQGEYAHLHKGSHLRTFHARPVLPLRFSLSPFHGEISLASSRHGKGKCNMIISLAGNTSYCM